MYFSGINFSILSLSRQSLSKSERLKSYKRIRLLFARGNRFKVDALLVYYHLRDETGAEMVGEPLQMGVSVGARYFKKAVDRNLMKRRIREAYRKNKATLKETLLANTSGLDLFFVYTSGELLAYPRIETAIQKSLGLLIEKVDIKRMPNIEN